MSVKIFLLLALVAIAMSAPLLVGPVDVQQEWTKWKTEHKKSYDTPEEEAKRFDIFKKNVDAIVEHNKKYQAGEVTYTQGLNQMADLTQEEFSSHYLGLKVPKDADSKLTGAQ